MKLTLHKLPEGFIITSDEEANEKNLSKGEVYLNLEDYTLRKALTGNCWAIKGKRKIIAQQDQIDFSALKEEEQKEIGWFDVEKYWLEDTKTISFGNTNKNDHLNNYLKGFQKAQELLSDRRFTLEDMGKACLKSILYSARFGESSVDKVDEIIQSLSQPKSWEIEIEKVVDKIRILKLIKYGIF